MLADNSDAVPTPAIGSARVDLANNPHLGCPLQSNFRCSIPQDQRLTPTTHVVPNFSDNQSPTPTSIPSVCCEDPQSYSADDVWNLIPYDVPWGYKYENYRLGALPGPDGDSVFLRSPILDPIEELRRQRTVEACKNCRERHAKCSGTRPACSRCIAKGFFCQYASEPSPIKIEEACQNCRQTKLKCSGTRPACVRCISRRIVCQYASDIKHRGVLRITAVSSTSPASRVRNPRSIGKQRSLPNTESPVILDRLIKQEAHDKNTIGSPFSRTSKSPTLVSRDSSTKSEESERLNHFAHVNAYTANSLTGGKCDDLIILPPHTQRLSLTHGESLSNADAFHTLPNPISSVLDPLPVHQMVPTSLLDTNRIYYGQPYESVESHQTDLVAASSTYAPYDAQNFIPSSQDEHYELSSSFDLPWIDYMGSSDIRPICGESSLQYEPYAEYAQI